MTAIADTIDVVNSAVSKAESVLRSLGLNITITDLTFRD